MSLMNQYLVVLAALTSAGVALPQKKETPAPPPLSSEVAVQGTPTHVALTELMGAEVQLESAAADKAPASDASRGRVAEFVLSTNGGEIACAALSVGKLIGPGDKSGDKIVLVPMTAIRPAMVDKHPGFVLRMTKAEIEALPPFEIRKAEAEGLDKAVEQARGLGSGAAAPAAAPKEKGKEPGQDPADPKGPAAARGAPGKAGSPEYVLSGVLKNIAVDASDKEFGKVQDAAVELGSNAVGYLVVSKAEAGGGGGLTLVPFRALQWTHAEGKDALKVGKSVEQLKAAPEYKKPEKTIATADQMRAADGFFGGKAGAVNPQ